jgi:EAL domain-containing protein (putative c-di-GMP-specific phosphodiesterase class I)/ActR/RegA family two-component response regulator
MGQDFLREKSTTPSHANAGPPMLLVDDDPFTLKLIGRLLAKQGFHRVRACSSGREALEIMDGWADTSDKLVLCDLQMPHMDGVQFVRHLVERRYAGSLILVSGADDKVLQTAVKLVRAHRLSILGYLKKPITAQEVEDLIARWKPGIAGGAGQLQPAYSADAVRAAITARELTNEYQPKVDIRTGKVVGVETLVRWQHPIDGLVFPDRFIGIAEENALIDDLTRVVLTVAFVQGRRWREQGIELRVAVNVSMDNLTSLDFPDFAAHTACVAGIDPEDVVLEVTEGRLMRDPRSAMDVLTRLRLKGFGLSIDDFGTGYSSLAQLRDLPFDELKVDRSFVHGAAADDAIRAIFEASQNLAHQLGLQMVAEGVEDRTDWEFLRSTRCDMAQGYFVARPMKGDAIPGWITGWDARQGPGRSIP